ncbi:hypothetical protein SAMN05421813_10437 [Daejeonella rubra]|uniref:Uncharacterized protein n=1 Tax=Daejeonella rubra TaxID=990371 RepID=A0A1G9P9N5_9SPHI|nr:hypothetical protein [Daejeonella rubra]SDL95273.1 hypothetical protein SAMN05421813_10437 [Daejeonella rubra]
MRASPIFLLFFILLSCKPAEEKAFKAPYADIKGFFEAEVLRLTRNKSAVDKTIEQNGLSETKTSLSIDWENELSLFTGSDINKAAWQDSYKIIEDSSSVSYHAIDPNLRTREIRIIKDINGKPRQIKIKNISRNYLYESSETLIYIPDSAYSIDKNQKVILLGKNSYRINAEIIK